MPRALLRRALKHRFTREWLLSPPEYLLHDSVFRIQFFALVLIVAGCIYFSIGELRYVFSGRTVEAHVVRMERVITQGRRGMPFPKLVCEYEFADGERTRAESDDLPEDWPQAKGETIAVQYIPGTMSSRVKGNDHVGWLWTSGVVLVLGVV